MEDTLGAIRGFVAQEDGSLNPCFNGRYSRRKFGSKKQKT